MKGLSPPEYEAILRSDFWFFAQRCFAELNPQTTFATNWHLEVIAAKLTQVREGKIQRLIINKPHRIDFIELIFHPMKRKRPTVFLSPAVGWNEQSL